MNCREVPIKQVVKRIGYSRKLVRSVLRGQRSDMFRIRQTTLETWLPWLDSCWAQGARNASALWRKMRDKGFRGQIGVVSEWARKNPSTPSKIDRRCLLLMSSKGAPKSRFNAVCNFKDRAAII